VSGLDGTFEALGDPTRRGVIDLLRRGPRRASEVADALGVTRPALSRHLRVLRETGLIEESGDASDARVKILQLRPERFDELGAWLRDVERYWTLELASFKAHAERTRGTKT
jgi:DNA-binding transcriptional ArsR family regulator